MQLDILEEQMQQDRKIYHDGISIKIYHDVDPDKVIISFTDYITAYYKIKRAKIQNKGIYCNGISSLLSRYLQDNDIPTYFISKISDREQKCYLVDMFPIEIIMRNVIAGSMSSRLGIEVGTIPSNPIIELSYKLDYLADPVINDSIALALNLVTKEELDEIYRLSYKINNVLVPLFEKIGITLVDYKIEFGRTKDGRIVLSDDINPDTARFWDKHTGESLDKDRYRKDSGNVGAAYKEVYNRLTTIIKENNG